MIQSVYGHDIKDLEARRKFLLDNADQVVEMNYHKPFDTDELADKKTKLSDVCIRINDLEEQVKAYRDEIGLELKPMREERQNLLQDIKSKGRVVKEKCYMFIEKEDKMVCYYNAEGILVSSRPATREEMGGTVFQLMRQAQ